MTQRKSFIKSRPLRDLIQIAFGSAFLVVCSWLTIPFPVPFTMQLFSVYLLILLFGGVKSLSSICVYLLLGAVGLPVFSGFQSGIGHLIGPLGGFLFGMLFLCAFTCIPLFKPVIRITIGTAICYLTGSVWYALFTQGTTSFGVILLTTVLPFVPLDALKLYLACAVAKRMRPIFNGERYD